MLNWPARSPDLNPIENVWSILDKKLTREPHSSLDHLKATLSDFFDHLSIEYCKNLFDSIKRRCIANKGGHIPY